MQLIFFGNRIGYSVLRSHFGEAHKLRLQSYSSTPESSWCRILFTGPDSYELQNYKSNVSSAESKQKYKNEKKTKKWKSNDEANSIILKSFTPYTPCECQHERDRVQFFSLITSQSITSDCPAKTVQSYNHTIVLRTIYTSCTILRSTPHTKLEMAADRQIGQGG